MNSMNATPTKRKAAMPTLIVENVPVEVYERLQQRAATQHRSLPEEMLHLLERVLRENDPPAPRLPDFVPDEEISAPFDLARSSQPTAVVTRPGQERLPDGEPESSSDSPDRMRRNRESQDPARPHF
jgi:plasmid stability protein